MATLTIQKLQLNAESATPETQGTITIFPDELVERIIFFTEKSDKYHTRLVNRQWNILTLSASKFSQKPNLEQFIRLLIENLKKHRRCVSDLAETSDMLQSLDRFLVTPAQTERLFLVTKGFIVGVIRKLNIERREKLQQKIGHQIPNSLSHLFNFANLTLENSIGTGDLDKFYLVWYSHRSYSVDDLGKAAISAAKIGNTQILHTLLSTKGISTEHRELAIQYALEHHHLACVAPLVASGPISEPLRGKAVVEATNEDNTKVVQLLLTNASIPEENRGEALIKAIWLNNKTLVQWLIGNGPIPKKYKWMVPNAAAAHKDPQLNRLLRSYDLL